VSRYHAGSVLLYRSLVVDVKKKMLCSVVAGLSLSGVVVVLGALPFLFSHRSGVQDSRDSWCKRQMV